MSIFKSLADQVLRFMGELIPTASQPSKSVSDWSLGLARFEVKGIFSA
jgi:hypothetical protein